MFHEELEESLAFGGQQPRPKWLGFISNNDVSTPSRWRRFCSQETRAFLWQRNRVDERLGARFGGGPRRVFPKRPSTSEAPEHSRFSYPTPIRPETKITLLGPDPGPLFSVAARHDDGILALLVVNVVHGQLE